jgi:molybdenum cofactor synthesis domain-containing protein
MASSLLEWSGEGAIAASILPSRADGSRPGPWSTRAPCYHVGPMAKTAGIVLIGNEILSGKVVDANAAYLCRELRGLGVAVRKIAVVPDEIDAIATEVQEFSRAYDVVFTSGGVGPTHDDVTMDGVARAVGTRLVRDARLVALLQGFYRGHLTDARLKMAEVPEGAELVAGEGLVFPAVAIRNVYILPGVPEIFRQKFEALRERFREAPFFLASVFVSIGEGSLADYLNDLLARHPELLLGSYPEFANPEYKVKVTLESKDRVLMERAVDDLLARLPAGSVVRIER